MRELGLQRRSIDLDHVGAGVALASLPYLAIGEAWVAFAGLSIFVALRLLWRALRRGRPRNRGRYIRPDYIGAAMALVPCLYFASVGVWPWLILGKLFHAPLGMAAVFALIALRHLWNGWRIGADGCR